MADKRNVVLDDMKDQKTAAADARKNIGGDTKTVAPEGIRRGVVEVPPNCPEGQQMSKDGVCREVFDEDGNLLVLPLPKKT